MIRGTSGTTEFQGVIPYVRGKEWSHKWISTPLWYRIYKQDTFKETLGCIHTAEAKSVKQRTFRYSPWRRYFLFSFFCKSQFATNLVGLSWSRVNCKGSWIKRRFIHTYLSWCSRCSNIFRYFLYNVLQLNCECLCVYSRSWIPRKLGTSRILQILRNLINNAELLSSSFEIIFYNSYNSCALYFRSLELSGCF